MAEREEIVRVMRDYFARPSSYHEDPYHSPIKWEGDMPKLHVSSFYRRHDDAFLLEVYHEAVRRSGHQIDFFGGADDE